MAAALAGTLLGGIPSQPAQAYNLLGCKWNTTNISFYVPSPYVSFPSWVNAASRYSGLQASITWRNIANPHFTGLNESRGNTVVWTGVYRLRGTVESPPACSGGLWTAGRNEVVINWTLTNGFTAAQREGVCGHELGHAFGLAHNQATGSGGKPVALMFQGAATRNQHNVVVPQTDDRNGVNAIY